MTIYSEFQRISTTILANHLPIHQIMSIDVRPLWQGIPRVAGPAFTVRCSPGDNLMLHAAIYRANPGSVIVVEAGDAEYAVAGGNVCAVAQKRGIAAFVIDGTIRDVGEIRSRQFPVYARGLSPIPGGKNIIGELNSVVQCCRVKVRPDDVVVADEDGIVVVPAARQEEILGKAKAQAAKEESEDLESWEAAHQARIDEILRMKGFTE